MSPAAEGIAVSRSRIAWVGLLLLGLSFTPALSQNGEGKRSALLVGVNKYEHAKFPNLRFAENDAQAMAQLLRDNGYEVTLLTSADATLPKIRAALKAVTGPRKRGDLVLVGLAGHGLQF